MRPIVLFLGLCGLIGGISAAAAETQQLTFGANSPAIIGNDNKVIYNDIDARALKRLNDELDAKDLTIAQRIKEAEEWARKYREVDRQLTEARSQAAAKGADATLLKTAQDLLHEGKLEEAGKIYDQLLSHAEPDVDRAAQYHFSRAQIYALQFRPFDALPHYAKAYQYRPDRLEYADEYAFTLIDQKEHKKAESVCDNLLSQLRGLTAQNPAAYRPALAAILIRLGVVYDETQRFGDAESAYKEALDIRRGLAAQNPAAYRPALAKTLTNLGDCLRRDAALRRRGERLQGSLGHPARPRRPEPRRLPARPRHDPHQSGDCLPDTQRFGDAESAYKEALDIAARPRRPEPRRLPARPRQHPHQSGGHLCTRRSASATRRAPTRKPWTSGAASPPRTPPPTGPPSPQSSPIWGSLRRDAALRRRGERFKEALDIRRGLAAQNPAAYRPALAKTLINLGTVYRDTQRFGDAESAYKEALDIQRGLAAQNPAAYRPALAMILTNLGTVYDATQRFGDAESAYKEALDIQRGLAAQNPAAYRPALAKILTNLGTVYHNMQRFGDAESAYKEALDIRRGLAAQNPAAYRPALANTLTNLGTVYDATQRFGDAESAYKEALDIRRGLAAQNPAAYRAIAITLANLAKLYRETHRSAEAEAAEDENIEEYSRPSFTAEPRSASRSDGVERISL